MSRPQLAWEVSQATGERLDQSYIARIEEGSIQRPGKDRLRVIAEILKWSPEEALRLADYRADTEEDAPELTWVQREAVELLGPMSATEQEAVLRVLRVTVDAMRISTGQG